MTSDHNDLIAVWEARSKPGRENEVRARISRVVIPSRADSGNLGYDVYEDEARPGTFLVFERWASRTDLENHTQSAWIPELIPPLLELIEGEIEDGLRLLRPLSPTQ